MYAWRGEGTRTYFKMLNIFKCVGDGKTDDFSFSCLDLLSQFSTVIVFKWGLLKGLFV